MRKIRSCSGALCAKFKKGRKAYPITKKEIHQLKEGIGVEEEHKRTYNLIRRKGLPKPKEFYGNISIDHIEEREDYYPRLKKARL